MHTHHPKHIQEKLPAVILVGNPNVGKSVIFQHLTGKYVTVSNYPGTTVEVTQGYGKFSGKQYRIIDTPGINSLIPKSEDERVTRDVLITESVACIVQVADSKNLLRTLQLTLQLIEFNLPLILVLNMADEAKDRGIKINVAKLRVLLSIPVIETVAITGQGISQLKSQITGQFAPEIQPVNSNVPYGEVLDPVITQIQELLPQKMIGKRTVATMLVSGEVFDSGGAIRELPLLSQQQTDLIRVLTTELQKKFAKPIAVVLAEKQLKRAQEIVDQIMTPVGFRFSFEEKLSRVTLHPVSGGIIVLLILYLMYLFVGLLAAGRGVDFLQNTLFGKYLNPIVILLVQKTIPIKFLQEMLVGKYGLITMALTYALAIIFPIVTAFFIFFGLLEDSGYLPRLAVMSDRVFRQLGLNGKAVLPMVLGIGCGTMAVLTSRILDTKKERLITILLLGLAIPCSAQLGVILAILSALSWKAMMIWLLSIMVSLFFVGYLADRLLPGKRSNFILELPPLRIPQVKNILVKTTARIQWYLKEAVPLFILGTLLLFFLDSFGALLWIEHRMAPIIVQLLGLPAKVTESFLIGFLRRDYGAAGLLIMTKQGLLTPQQVVVAAVAITLFIPCIAQFFVTIKEQGIKIALLVLGFVITYAFLFSGLLNLILTRVHV